MSGHIKLLAILHIILGALGVIVGLFLLMLFGGIAALVGIADGSGAGAAIAVPILGILGTIICAIAVVLGLPGIVAGLGLLYLQPWARFLTIVLSGLQLLNFPFGTILGAYGLWVLLSAEGERVFYSPQRV
ncbi:MAG: hypothetical protein JNL98_36815 [Bryobacterales bacterium]|nr:hypothetical protein [Bryobacterales bacterium]